jgi:signal transduction histidine kinase
VSIRFQLLIVALTTLILPWAGCQYARELETALRTSQERALEASAGTIAQALSAQPERVFRNLDDTRPFAQNEGDFYVHRLHNQPLLDGYRDDWGVAAEPQSLPSADAYAARLLAGSTERYLFLYLEVDDPHFVAEPADPHPDRDSFDRVDLTVQGPDGGSSQSYFFATGAPGLIEAQRLVHDEDGVDRAVSEPRMQAFWLQTSQGYHLEARIPSSLVGSRVWIEARDSRGRTAGFSAADPASGGRLFRATPGLDDLLAIFIRAGTRASVIDANGLKLGIAGSLEPSASDAAAGGGREAAASGGAAADAAQADGDGTDGDEAAHAGTWYRRFVTGDISSWPLQAVFPDRITGRSVAEALAGHRAAEWLRTDRQESLLLAAAPITLGGKVRGVVVLEQGGEQLLELRDRALTHLFNLTLFATALAMLFAFSVAAYISLRIGRLRAAADSAVGNDGRIRLDMPESGSGDEIGALARAFEQLLARLNEHTQYLRTLGGKLAHELRTPLTIMRSSLDNLESEGLRADQQGYTARAREGVSRLQSILSALGAAARVEESIKQAERVNFDLRELLRSALSGYRDAFQGVRFDLDAPGDACFLRGAPDLILQMLDKLVENAVDFCPPSGLITVRLARSGGHYELSVINDGPPIPSGVLERLFESLFEHRTGHDDKPHFGLGLYIVRLIAEFHEGKALAANRADGGGAIFTVTLPLI